MASHGVVFAPLLPRNFPTVSIVSPSMTKRLTIPEVAKALGISIKSVRRRIEKQELEAEKVNGKWIVDISDQLRENSGQDSDQSELIDTLRDEIKHLRELLERRDLQNDSMSQQIDHLSQLLAVAHKSLQQVTEKYQFLEDKRRSSLWQRLKTTFAGA